MYDVVRIAEAAVPYIYRGKGFKLDFESKQIILTIDFQFLIVFFHMYVLRLV